MEDNAACHASHWTNQERENAGIVKVDWPPNSPDFNPIEKIWTIMKRRIQRRRGVQRITTLLQMKTVLVEEWEKITIEEINTQIALLPKTMENCINQSGGNRFHA
jgi:transposase